MCSFTHISPKYHTATPVRSYDTSLKIFQYPHFYRREKKSLTRYKDKDTPVSQTFPDITQEKQTVKIAQIYGSIFFMIKFDLIVGKVQQQYTRVGL